jgi:AP-2 complex subunit alpha
MSNTLRGLNVFIADIRNCRGKELEEKRVNKELANIRVKFKDDGLNGYHKSKYVAKLLYMHITGWPVDIGFHEATRLASSNKYHEKRMGYLAISLLSSEKDESLQSEVIGVIKHDLGSSRETDVCLALSAISNISVDFDEGPGQFAENVLKLMSDDNSSFIKNKACLCLLSIIRKGLEIGDWTGIPRLFNMS